jgi:hypothetical protein
MPPPGHRASPAARLPPEISTVPCPRSCDGPDRLPTMTAASTSSPRLTMPPSIYRLCPPSSLCLPLILYRGLLLGEIHGRVSSSTRSTAGQAHPAHAALHGIAVPADLLCPTVHSPQRAALHGTPGSRSPTRRDPWLESSSTAEPTSHLSDRGMLPTPDIGCGLKIQ